MSHESSADDRGLREQEQLRYRSEQFETLLNEAPLGMYLVDADFRLAQVNAAARPVFGDIPDLIGRDFDEVVRIIWPPDVAEPIVATFRHTIRTGETHHAPELASVRADRGTVEYYDWRVSRTVLPDGRHGVVCYFRDISAEVDARHALSRSEARYRTLFESIDEGFCILQLIFDADDKPIDYRYIEINSVFEQQTGMTGALGRTVRELVPGIEAFWFDIYGTVALTGQPRRFVDHAESMGRWFDVYAFRIGDPEDRQVAVLFNDVTGRRQMEDALRAAHEAEQRSNRAKDEFLAMLGHELRNPLAPIRTALQVLHLRGERAPELGVIDRQVSHLTRLVDDLLDVSRITHGTIELRRQPIALREIVQRASELAGPLLEQRRNRLDVRVPDGIVIDADRDRMAQVVSNLLSNASKYSDIGSRIRLTGERDGDRARVIVQDEGSGISPEMHAAVFEPFVQQPQSLDRTQGGLGLGLAIVRTLVAAHGGNVRIDTQGLDRGSRFIVEVGAVDPVDVRREAAVPASSSIAPRSADRILVVDDNADAAQMLQTALEHLGYRVEVAGDGVAALDRARSFDPTVVLLDIGLPQMDGYEVARRLRAEAAGRRLHLISLTGYGQDSDRERSREAGIDHHLVKPVDLHTLEQLLQEEN
jgi:PAS domain S-box-containing protein